MPRTLPISLSLLCFAILASGCETNPPSFVAPAAAEIGKIYVYANVDSAAIFLDGASTGKITPDTLSAVVGTHLLRLEKPGFAPATQSVRVGRDSLTVLACALIPVTAQKLILVEDFSNVSCGPCVLSNLILHSLARDTFGDDRLVVVKYATNFPSPTDPFYTANRGDADARMSYYSILFVPTLIIDGVARPTPTDSSAIGDSISARLSQAPKLSITVTQTIAGGILTVGVVVVPLDTTGLDFAHLVLHTVVTETNIAFNVPPGSNGETTFYDVMRVMLPSNGGESLAAQNRFGSVVYQRQTALAPAWSVSNLHVIAFVQHRPTGLVVQSGSTW